MNNSLPPALGDITKPILQALQDATAHGRRIGKIEIAMDVKQALASAASVAQPGKVLAHIQQLFGYPCEVDVSLDSGQFRLVDDYRDPMQRAGNSLPPE